MSISQNFPEEGPTLNLNFAGSKTLDPRITFSRTSTGTYMDDSGLIVTAPADSPRFDHRYVNGEIESLGLLVEESRSNLLTYSDTLVTGWSHIGFTSNAVDSTYPNPTGNLGTKKLVEETGNTSNQKVLYEDVTVGNNDQVFSHSIFVKPIGDRNAQISIHNVAPSNAKGFTVNFNLSDLTTFTTSASSSSSLDDYGVVPYPNGWYKIYVVGNTGSLNSDGTTLRFHLRILDSSGNQIYTGDGSSGLYAYGAQMELGAFPTSYIPTSGSTATRNHDRAVIEGSNFTDIFNTNFNNFSMFVNYDNTDTDNGTSYSIIQFWGESTNFDNRVEFFKDNASPYHIETRAFGGGSAIFSNGNLSGISAQSVQKLATSWSVDYSTSSGASRRWAFSFSGESVDVVNDNTGTTIPSLTRIGFGINPTRTDSDGGKIHFKQISLYSNTLTDSQLQALTK